MRKTEAFNRDIVIAPRAKIAKGETRLRRVRGADAGQVQVEPVLAVQSDLRAIQKFGTMPIHMRHLRALLAGIEPGSRCLETRTILAAPGKAADGRRGAGIEPEPGIADGTVICSDEPGSVALRGHGQRGRSLRQSIELFAKALQRGYTVRPGLRQGLCGRAVISGYIDVAHGGAGQLPPGEVEGDGLDDRRASIDTDNDISTVTHDTSPRAPISALAPLHIPSLEFLPSSQTPPPRSAGDSYSRTKRDADLITRPYWPQSFISHKHNVDVEINFRFRIFFHKPQILSRSPPRRLNP